MKIDDKIRDKKLQYDINKKAVKIWALSSGKIYKYESVTGEEILHFNKTQIIEREVFTFSFRKSIWKTNRKTGWCYRISRKTF